MKCETHSINESQQFSLLRSSEFINETQLQTAAYVRGTFKSYQKFGDIVSLARGRLETDDDNNFVFIEMDRNECKKFNCSLNDNDGKNVTAFWLVEKIRHRDEKRGHRYELRITIFPVKKYRLESKRDATDSATIQPRRRSFLIREQDYPKYFDETMKPSSKIQKRFFDLVGSLSENPYEEYQIPFSLGAYHNRYPDDLNTGEYYHPKRNGEQFYQRPVATTSSYGGLVQFPDSGVTTKDFLEATRNYPINPFTATHLHHHYYLNRNNVPLIKATGFEKETIYDNQSDDFRQSIRVRNPQVDDAPNQIQHQQSDHIHSSKEHQQEPSASPQNNAIPTAVGLGYNFYTEQPRNVYEVSDPSGIIFSNNQNLQTPYSLSDQVPAPPLQFGQFYQQSPYTHTHPLQLQVATPPQQQYLGNTHENAPITAIPYRQYPLEPFRPIIDYPARFNRQQFPIQNNDVNYNQQFESNRYSEPDPIYHGENIPLPPYMTRQIGFDPVIDIGNHQQSTPTSTSKPTSNQLQENVKPEKQTVAKTEYDNQRKRPERQRVKVEQQKIDPNEQQTNYPDSINAQLPPPEQDDDLTVPYVESSVITQTSLVQSTSAESTVHPKPKRIRPRGYYGPRTTTEKPILKWMPKKTKPRQPSDDNASTSSPTTTTESVITITPVNVHSEEPRTSVSTSISVQVGSNHEARVLADSEKSSTDPTNNSTDGSESEAEFNGFLPTVIPNVQLLRGKIDAVDTNVSNLKLFRAGEVDNDAEEDHVAQSIISHASGL